MWGGGGGRTAEFISDRPVWERGSPQLLGPSPVYLRATPIRDIVLLLVLLRGGPALSVKYDIYDRQ